jgi:hypothetical protein
MAALRVGCTPKLDSDATLIEAVELVKGKDAVVCVIDTQPRF